MRHYPIIFCLTFTFGVALALAATGNDGLRAQGEEAAQPPAPVGAALGLFRPDSPLYSFQQLGEWLKLRLTFNPLGRAKYELTLMERRAEELRDLAERGRLTVERAESLQRRSEKLFEDVRKRVETASERGLNVEELTQKMQTILNRQQTVLQEVSERVPAEAKDAIQRAIEVSVRGKERVLEWLETMPLPDRPTVVPGQPQTDVTPTPQPTHQPPTPRSTPQPTPRSTLRPMPTGELSWEECVRIPGAIMTMSYPSQCIAPDGRRAIQPIPEEERPVTPPAVTPVTTPSPTVINITVEGDDNGLYPPTITVPRGATIRLTFKVRSQNVYYGGLDFRSNGFRNTPRVRPGESYTVEFVANESFDYTSWWPASNVKKADGRVNVQ